MKYPVGSIISTNPDRRYNCEVVAHHNGHYVVQSPFGQYFAVDKDCAAPAISDDVMVITTKTGCDYNTALSILQSIGK
jgi:hypothetical protein